MNKEEKMVRIHQPFSGAAQGSLLTKVFDSLPNFQAIGKIKVLGSAGKQGQYKQIAGLSTDEERSVDINPSWPKEDTGRNKSRDKVLILPNCVCTSWNPCFIKQLKSCMKKHKYTVKGNYKNVLYVKLH